MDLIVRAPGLADPERAEIAQTARLNRMAALRAERADLDAENEKAEAWGAGVGARIERLDAIASEMAMLERREADHG